MSRYNAYNSATATTRSNTAALENTASHAIHYKLHDATAAGIIADTLGHGPAGQLAGTLTNILSNAGWLTLAGDNFCNLRGNSYINALFSFSSGAIVSAWDFFPFSA